MKCASIILSIVLSVMAVCQVRAADIEEKKITITAHRGGAALAPENTLAAVRLGMELGVDYIEIDIHQTADNQLVVCHDMTIDRTTNGRGKICNMTLDEIRSFNIVYCDSVTDLKIPALDEVLALVDGKTKLLIEIKKKQDLYPDIERLLLEMIEKYNIQNSVVIQSFNDSVLEKIYKLNPNIRLEKLLLMRVFPFVILDGSGEFSRFNQKKYSYISSFNIWHQGYTKRFEKKVKRWGKEVKVWCINNPENLSPQFNPDGVITDRPDLWIK